MDIKLTLKLEENIIKKAKKYARSNQQSLSKLVENFFKTLTENSNKEDEAVSPTVKSLIGIIKGKEEIDIYKEYTEYLEIKYK